MSMFLIISAIIYSSMLNVVYHSRKHREEATVFSSLLAFNLVGLILELLNSVCGKFESISPLFATMMTRFYLLYLMGFLLVFTLYMFEICYKTSSEKREDYFKKLKKFSGVIFYVAAVVLIFLPITFYEGHAIGKGIDFFYIWAFISMGVWLITIMKNVKKVRGKKFVPALFFILLTIAHFLIQKSEPGIMLMATIHTFIVFLVYFTRGNRDESTQTGYNVATNCIQNKNEFLARISYDIRTPLNAIVGLSNCLLADATDPAVREDAKDIIKASESLLELVDGIVDISKLEVNKIEMINSEYEVKDLLESIVATAKSKLAEKAITFKYSFDDELPKYLYGDAARVKQVCLALINNSIKYTSHGFIEFKVDSIVKGDTVRLIISVEDSGVGIKREDIDKLLKKFSKSELEKNIAIESSGFGLAITKRLVDMMNGKIVVQSEYGSGSKFLVAVDQGLGHTIASDKVTEEIELALPALHISFKDKKVLVIDDNHLNLKVAEKLLKPYNVIVTSANDGEEGLEYIGEEKYDLILLDDVMPGKNGVEILKEIHEKFPGYDTPIVVMTANAIVGMKEQYLSDGFDEYLAKPIDKVELERILNRFLK